MIILLAISFLLVLICVVILRRTSFRPLPWFVKMSAVRRFRGPFAYGGFVFLLNMIIFITLAGLFVASITVSFAGAFILFLLIGISLSMFVWIQASISRGGKTKDKWITGVIGSIFYFAVMIYLFLQIFQVPADTPEGQIQIVGLMLGFVITLTAGVTCILTIRFAREKGSV
ncbi:hypothetical protein [Paenibacillus lutrae]|uniref:Uncharacterized protein n=1 Tax=Paenibacillus lutrae TaxID=2078573 RepID=A0A7X3FMT7_9BACL|nr:hypothetical protein [Paenibacillus lutrae]MVP02374.1 hypothetical protein [Paenibacillus lutrae]